jgi:hypothetical protein
VPALDWLPVRSTLAIRDSGLTTRGPGNKEASPRPKARRFSTFSSFFSAKFPAAEVIRVSSVNRCALWVEGLRYIYANRSINRRM